MTAAHRIQPTIGSMLRLTIPMISSLRTEIVPPSRAICRTMPWIPKKNARVTTKAGIPILATRKPMTAPTVAPTRKPVGIATHGEMPCGGAIIHAIVTTERPAV